MKKIGERVILKTLLKEGDFPGEIIDIDPMFGLCSVKLDCQDKPVTSVLYFDEPPEVVNSSLWQICYPAARPTKREGDNATKPRKYYLTHHDDEISKSEGI